MDMNLNQALQTFIAESRELLEDVEHALLAVEKAEDKAETVNAIFRAVHTIKGSSGLFGLEHVVAFTHALESVLDRVRRGELQIGDGLMALLLRCCDHIGALIDTVAAGQMDADADLTQQGAPLTAQLQGYLAGDPAAAPGSGALAPQDFDATERIESGALHTDCWHISLRFGPDVLKNGMDPLSFIRYLATLGKIRGIATLPDAMPALESMDPETCYLGYEIALESSADKRAIESAFEFVRDDCLIHILPPHSRIEEYVRLIGDLPEQPARIGELLVSCGTLTEHELAAALKAQAGAEPPPPIGAILVEQRTVQPEVVEAALAKQKRACDLKAQESQSVRVDAGKLDRLIDLVGELIIAGASANLIARRTQNAELQECGSKLSTLVEEVRDSALQLRMVKIGATFKRFQRVVHDVSRELGKDIELLIDGEDTELDKTVVEKIGDPLTHLVRNAIDHGIEAADVRRACGKPAAGSIRLNACHDSGSIVITVSDDGGGLKRERILAKAVERGLVDAGSHLSDEEVYALIFEPGFSTAQQVSNLSGRGVGMDVVKRNIAALRGSVEIQSAAGVGTTVAVRLPLTLAIIDGFLVEVGGSIFAIPLDMVEECVQFSAEPGHDYTDLRGEVLPFIRLNQLFGIAGRTSRRQNIVVLKHAGQRAGLVVDTLLGEFQTVIKPLHKMFGQIKCISGSTILGSGEVALILDVPALVQQATKAMPATANAAGSAVLMG